MFNYAELKRVHQEGSDIDIYLQAMISGWGLMSDDTDGRQPRTLRKAIVKTIPLDEQVFLEKTRTREQLILSVFELTTYYVANYYRTVSARLLLLVLIDAPESLVLSLKSDWSQILV